MSKENKRADILAVNVAFVAMATMLQSSKKIDELKTCPAYVKDGIIYDFNGKKFWATNSEDCEIFKNERVMKAQAVTVALKRDYVQALNDWLGTDETDEDVEDVETVDEVTPEFNLKDEVKNLIHLGRMKKAKKLIKDNQDHPDIKKAKKLYKKATKGDS